MPLIDITYEPTVGKDILRRLATVLPDLVAEAVDCPEEPWVGPPGPGDIEIRFRERSPLDLGELSVVVEVRTKLFPSRVGDKQRRRPAAGPVSGLNLGSFGVWLILAEGAWSHPDGGRGPEPNDGSARALADGEGEGVPERGVL